MTLDAMFISSQPDALPMCTPTSSRFDYFLLRSFLDKYSQKMYSKAEVRQ